MEYEKELKEKGKCGLEIATLPAVIFPVISFDDDDGDGGDDGGLPVLGFSRYCMPFNKK